MKRLWLSALVAVLVLGCMWRGAGAQETSAPAGIHHRQGLPDALLWPGKGSRFSLIDPSKLTMSQSYTMSFFSGGGWSGAIALYANTLHYQISPALSATVRVGYLHQPFGVLSGSVRYPQGIVVPGFRLRYQPSRNLLLELDYGLGSGYYSPASEREWLWGDR